MNHKMSFNFLINKREWELTIVKDKETLKLYFSELEYVILLKDLMVYHSICVLNNEDEAEILLKDILIKISVDNLKNLIKDMVELKKELNLLVMSN